MSIFEQPAEIGWSAVLTTSQLEAMIAHARHEAPRECCGLAVGHGDRVTRIVPVTNLAPGNTRYEADPRELIRHFREMDEQGEELVGIYHSHPSSPALPSPTDLSLAFYPESVYLIISLANPDEPSVRAWRLIDGEAAEVDLLVEDDGDSET